MEVGFYIPRGLLLLLACLLLPAICLLLLACSYHSVHDRRKGPHLSCTPKVPYICLSPLPVTETQQFRPILGTRRSPTVRTLPPGSVRSIWNLRISATTWRSYTVSFFPTTVSDFLLPLKKKLSFLCSQVSILRFL